MAYRIEKDALGKKEVPKEALYGIHTQRAKENFQISGKTLPLEIFYAIAEIKIAAANANYGLKLLNNKKRNTIIKAAKEILKGKHDKEFVIDAFQAGAGTSTHMNINEVIANRALQLLKRKKGNYKVIHPNDDVNKGQSSNDVFPSAIKMVVVKKIKDLIIALRELKISLSRKAKEFKSVKKSGRTHLQDAVPITLGQEFHAYATTIEKNILRINNNIKYLLELNIGKNAIGTGINTNPKFSKLIIKHLIKLNKIPWKESKDPIYTTQNITDFLQFSETIKSLAVDLNKIANDLRLLSSGPNTGLREIKLPAVEPGSSIMPGKVNPSIAEMLNMVCFQVIGNNEAISEATAAGQLELNVMTPLIAKNLIENIEILTKAIKTFNERCVKGIKADKEVCQYYFEHSVGLATLLNPYIGYDKAAEIVNKSLRTGKTIAQLVLEKKLLTKEQLDKLLR